MDYDIRLNKLSLDSDKINELKLLWLGAKYNFLIAIDYYNKLDDDYKNDSIEIINKNNLNNNIDKKNSILSILFFDSCATRLYSIDEIIYLFNNNKKIYNSLKDTKYKDNYRMYIYEDIYYKKENSNKEKLINELKKNKSHIIHIVLRHVTAHKQNKSGVIKYKDAIDEFLGNTTIEELKNCLTDVINAINVDLKKIGIIDSKREDFLLRLK